MNLDNLWIPCTVLLMIMGSGILIHNLFKHRRQAVKTTLIFMVCWMIPITIYVIYKLIMIL